MERGLPDEKIAADGGGTVNEGAGGALCFAATLLPLLRGDFGDRLGGEEKNSAIAKKGGKDLTQEREFGELEQKNPLAEIGPCAMTRGER